LLSILEREAITDFEKSAISVAKQRSVALLHHAKKLCDYFDGGASDPSVVNNIVCNAYEIQYLMNSAISIRLARHELSKKRTGKP